MSKTTKNAPARAGGTVGRIALVSAIAALVSLAAVAALASSDAQAQAQAPPANTAEPGISGTPAQGQTLTGTTGTWTNSPTSYAFSWRRCGSDGGLPDASDCAAISGETGTTYVLQAGDVGFRIRFRVSATNGDGTQSAASNATTTVTSGGGGAPVNTGQPTISGTPNVGSSLTANNGTWSNSPTGFSHQWVRCGSDGGAADGSNCPAISGATSTSYVVQSTDSGFRLRVQVRATNASGTTLAASNATSLIGSGGSGAPSSTAPPALSGTSQQGNALATTTGTWTGAAPITYTYQWLRCNTSGGACALIAGQTKNTYTLATADVGKTVRSRVTAKNSTGTATSDSGQSPVVAAAGGGGGGGTCSSSIAGAITLPGGGVSIPVTSVSLPQRLIVQSVRFTPNPVTTRTQPFTMRVRVYDTRGCIVREALVFVRSTPVLTNGVPELRTAQDGWATFSILPRADFPLRTGYSVQFFVRTRKAGENVLAGVSARRLVQVGTRG